MNQSSSLTVQATGQPQSSNAADSELSPLNMVIGIVMIVISGYTPSTLEH